MIGRRYLLSSLCCLVFCLSGAAQTDQDPVLTAMKYEMARVRLLRLVSSDQPYYVEYALDDADAFSVSASLGGLVSSRHYRARIPRVQVRVGGYGFDNTNHVFSDFYTGTRFDFEEMPLDDNIMALRQQFWLATDRSYKTALEAIARKRAALQSVSVREKLNDFARAEPTRMLMSVKRSPINEAMWTGMMRKLSAVFGGYPQVTSSSLELEVVQSISYFLSSEGSECRVPDRLALVRVRAAGLAPDGMHVRDAAALQSLNPERMPSEAELRRGVTAVAENVSALARAPLGESYTGPVLFEDVAAAQLFAQLLGYNLALTRRPVSEPNRPIPIPTSEFEGRLGARVLPEWMDVVDDATQTEWRGHPLFGHYPIDMEGMVPKPVSLVEKGVLKGFLLTRQPVPGFEGSNGRARLPGPFGTKAARISNLFVRASQAAPAEELKKKLLEMTRQRNKPYGIVIRKLDFPSSASLSELRRLGASAQSGGSTRALSPPVLAYRVTPDGKEELVRGLQFRAVGARSLKDIVAASSENYGFDFLDNGAPFALMGAGGYVAGCSVIAPAVLFDDIELERPQEDVPTPPLAPPPPLKAAATAR